MHFYMEAKFGRLEKRTKTDDINRDEIFQNNNRVHPFWPQKECRNFGRVGSRTSWRSTKKIRIKLATTFNPLAPNDVYIRHTARLTSRRCILNMYSTNILTEYFKHAAHSPFFFCSRCLLFNNAIFFGSCNIHILNTGYATILKKIPAPKG